MGPALRISAFGLASWDQLLSIDTFPVPGFYEIVRAAVAQPGGTTSNMVVALQRLGISTSLAAMVGDDDSGQRLRDDLRNEGVDTSNIGIRSGVPTDTAIILVSGHGEATERTILWQQGAKLRHGDYLPITEFFDFDLVIVDLDDYRLRRMVVDLPMHVSPRTRLFGTMTYLVEFGQADAVELMFQHDFIVGNQREFEIVTGTDDLNQIITKLQQQMGASQLGCAAITRGAAGCILIDRSSVMYAPAYSVDVVDPTGAGDAFAAGFAYAIVSNMKLDETSRFANAMGALATTRLGARSGLPDLAAVKALVETGATP